MVRQFPPFGGSDDPDVLRAYDWLVSFFTAADWQRRSERIERQLEAGVRAGGGLRDYSSISISDDRVAWYLYLVGAALHAPHKYEPAQGARVLPLFKRIGTDLDVLQAIEGAENRIQRMVANEAQDPDSALFEILVALVWLRNGASHVSLLEESPPQKRPDIHASMGNEDWYVECKRLNTNSTYSNSERRKWLRMWEEARDILTGAGHSIVLYIVFHVELETLPDTFLVSELCGKLALVEAPCVVVSNGVWEVSIEPVDYRAANEHLSRYFVKYPSDQVIELIAGRRDPNRRFSGAIDGQFVRIGDEGGNNLFLDEISYAIGVFWSCDADRAIERKARDIRGRLAEAVQQLPDGERGVVHVGLETTDGQVVEMERYRRIVDSISGFDARTKDLRWVYCHLFQSYSPPTAGWVIDETVYYFGRGGDPDSEPISSRSAVVPEDEEDGADVPFHWLREPP